MAYHITEISNPKLVVLVGSLGLASNIVGLFLFHGELVAITAYPICQLILYQSMATTTVTRV